MWVGSAELGLCPHYELDECATPTYPDSCPISWVPGNVCVYVQCDNKPPPQDLPSLLGQALGGSFGAGGLIVALLVTVLFMFEQI